MQLTQLTLQVRQCARCGADHADVQASPLYRPMAPPDIQPAIVWSHWAVCPTTGQPIMIAVADKGDKGSDVVTLHGVDVRADGFPSGRVERRG